MGLRAKICFALFTLVIFTGGLLCTSVLFVEHGRIRREQQQARTKRFRDLLAVCREAELDHNPIVAINFVKVLAQDQAVRMAWCAEAGGRIIAHSDPARVGGFFNANSMEQEDIREVVHGGQFELAGWVGRTGERLGQVFVSYDAAAFDKARVLALEQLLKVMLLGAVLALPIAFLLAAGLARGMIVVIEGLAKATRGLSAGSCDLVLPASNRRDELGTLAREFAAMVRKLSELEQLKENFMASVTHDLRGPLTAIRAGAEVIGNEKMGALPESRKKWGDIITRNCSMLAECIDDILDYSRLQSGAWKFQAQPVNVGEIIQNVYELQSWNAAECKITFGVKVEPDLPPALADSRQLERVLTNLVFNAFKFTPSGGSVQVVAERDVDVVRVSVSDTGAGIPEVDLPHVFGKFYQVEATKNMARKAGTGLGLPICKSIIEGFGGRIWVRSRVGYGSVFAFVLPLAVSKEVTIISRSS